MPILHHDVRQYSEEHDRLKLGIPTSSNFHKIITPQGKPSHDEGLVKGSHHGDIERSPVASVSKVQAHLRDAARFRARSTSHAVAAHSSCTKIPLSAGRAQGRREPFSKAAFQAMACYGSSTWIRQD